MEYPETEIIEIENDDRKKNSYKIDKVNLVLNGTLVRIKWF